MSAPDDDGSAFLALVRDRLRDQGWTVERVARRGGISKYTVYSLMSRADPAAAKLATLHGLAVGLDLPLWRIISAIVRAPGPLAVPRDAEEGELLALWRQLPASGRRRVLLIAQDALDEDPPPDAMSGGGLGVTRQEDGRSLAD